MYSSEDYNCPWCGWEMDYDKVIYHPWVEYTLICPECKGEFETPDV